MSTRQQAALDAARELAYGHADKDVFEAANAVYLSLAEEMSIFLYCPACQENHLLGPRAVEDLIHGLIVSRSDEVADAEGEPATDPRGDFDAWRSVCLIAEAAGLRDPEQYAEHLESMRDARMDLMKPVSRETAGDGS